MEFKYKDNSQMLVERIVDRMTVRLIEIATFFGFIWLLVKVLEKSN